MKYDVPAIDLVAGNLYPFIETVTKGRPGLLEALEEIDIGGPTMIRAAAKNHPWVLPVIDPSDYNEILEM
ncbi:MAG: bifunctional phosphoribosylaminoimidazolecarboxamide formyltransferase/IMP cyclohydrolase, partial [Dehalococcoidia bacterium]|nr:bifunctional phosphoribosylaminoimidazolecarboxamide formyltransferase/IMP cyclohydrolase [Dehalococcoidia bacterium]